MEYSFTRYLAAKRTVDDRALNDHVWRTLRAALPAGPPDILEVGAGAGAMVERLAERGLLDAGGRYTAIDADPANVEEMARRLPARSLPVALELEAIDLYDFARRERGRRAWDLLVAHAVLDLLDAPRALPALFALLRPGGLFYFSINFDGLTILEPPVDPAFDEQVVALYHQTMDERRVSGRPSGDSRSGRRLLSQLPAAGGTILAAGSSDWVVLPRDGRYPADEAYFLHHLLHFFEHSLTGRPELDAARLAGWLARRHAQVEAAELIFIAHQLDICGRIG
ncbi:class I SAM-dependent methyltransferase [Promineifilum sp.]|uniref:class I SAM-dependent methyltransferase n=1 Tax=Promineifilum sp. TaxID=2664178 RepID=UPI0035AD9FE9